MNAAQHVTRESAKRQVGEGWWPLIDEFYEAFPSVGVIQVKEKYGRLCLYHSNVLLFFICCKYNLFHS